MQEVSIFSNLEQQVGSLGDVGLGFFFSAIFSVYIKFSFEVKTVKQCHQQKLQHLK